MPHQSSTALLAAIFFAPLLAIDLKAAESIARFPMPQADYVLHCGGCHGQNGISNSKLIPDLKGLAGYYLKVPEGRDYLARLPNVAFSSLSDDRLAAVLNYVVTDLGGAGTPPTAKPYAAAEVSRLRKQPLTEVTLSEYRLRLVQTLITRYQAPAALLLYGAN